MNFAALWGVQEAPEFEILTGPIILNSAVERQGWFLSLSKGQPTLVVGLSTISRINHPLDDS